MLTYFLSIIKFLNNARSETVDVKSTYKSAWAAGQRCIIPSEAIYEPNYESGEPVRWRIRKVNGEPMGIAGIYRTWTNADGEMVFHDYGERGRPPLHAQVPRTRSRKKVVILDPEQFEGWLTCPVAEAKTRYCRQWQGQLMGEPAPLPTRARGANRTSRAKPKEPPTRQGSSGELF